MIIGYLDPLGKSSKEEFQLWDLGESLTPTGRTPNRLKFWVIPYFSVSAPQTLTS